MTCIKVLRPTEKYCYLDTASTAFPPSPSSPSPSYDSRRPDKNSSGSGIRRSSSSTSYTESNDTLTLQSVGKSTSKDRDREKEKDKEGRGCKYVSCVTILIDKLLSVFERVRYLPNTKLCTCVHIPSSYFPSCFLSHLLFVSLFSFLFHSFLPSFPSTLPFLFYVTNNHPPPHHSPPHPSLVHHPPLPHHNSTEEVLGRDGYRLLSSFFFQVASLGVEEKALLLKVGAVRRVIKAVIAVNASVAQVGYI
jgi:hypothetical protein